MPVKIRVNKNSVTAKVIGAFDKGLPVLSEEILNDCNNYCKVGDSGVLQQSALDNSKPELGLLIWQTPYAKRQYWAIKTAYTVHNPNATWKWCEVAKRHHLKEWNEDAQKLMEMNL